MLAEQLADRPAVWDLSAERVALLCSVGLCDWMDAKDIDALLAQQDADGAWGSHGPENMPKTNATAHTAMLAFHAIAQRWAITPGHEAFPPQLPPK